MVHLLVYLIKEIEMCGPIYLLELHMKILKGYIKNQYHSKASIIKRYIAEGAIEFYLGYMQKQIS